MQELLADGRWHPRAEVVAEGARAVPPGVAWRRAERHRIEVQGNPPEPVPRRPDEEHEAIDSGGRRVANDVLRSLVKTGKVDRKVDGDGDWYRLARPEQWEASG